MSHNSKGRRGNMSNIKSVGGQAVIEGVMMRGSKGIATAVRLPNGSITVDFKDTLPLTKKYKIFGFPIIRGFISLVDSMIVGVKTLNYSASFFEDDEEEEPTGFDKWFSNTFKDNATNVLLGISLLVSVVFSVLLFFILPTFVANFFNKAFSTNKVLLNIIEGVIRVVIFIAYIFLIGRMKDIQRVFQYHGAEHKTIFCYENNVELTPENAAKFGRLHPRCGTNFMFLVMIVSIILFSLTPWTSLVQRALYRVLLLPVISGVTYEIIKWMGRSDSLISKILSYPGLMLQKITTSEPDLSQLEVAIKSLKVAEGIIDPVVEEIDATVAEVPIEEVVIDFK